MAKDKAPEATARYFAQVGPESIEVPAEHVVAHKDGAAFSTSAPILHYTVRITVGDDTYVGVGASWEAAEQAAAATMPKAVTL